MNRRIAPLIPLLCAAAASAAEVVRRDLQAAAGLADPGFDYRLSTPIGTFSGSDAWDGVQTARLGVRWAWARPGAQVAPLLGLDATGLSATGAGGGMRAWGASAAAGAAWAPADRWGIDAEGYGGWSRAELDIDTADGLGLAGSGNRTAWGGRARLTWNPLRSWTVGVEGGWESARTDLAGDRGRDLVLDSAAWNAAVVIGWRISARPAGLE